MPGKALLLRKTNARATGARWVPSSLLIGLPCDYLAESAVTPSPIGPDSWLELECDHLGDRLQQSASSAPTERLPELHKRVNAVRLVPRSDMNEEKLVHTFPCFHVVLCLT